jgi:polyphosphate kinase 2 (PPK2 family)
MISRHHLKPPSVDSEDSMDPPSRARCYGYSRGRDRMLEATDTKHAVRDLVRSDNNKHARPNC